MSVHEADPIAAEIPSVAHARGGTVIAAGEGNKHIPWVLLRMQPGRPQTFELLVSYGPSLFTGAWFKNYAVVPLDRINAIDLGAMLLVLTTDKPALIAGHTYRRIQDVAERVLEPPVTRAQGGFSELRAVLSFGGDGGTAVVAWNVVIEEPGDGPESFTRLSFIPQHVFESGRVAPYETTYKDGREVRRFSKPGVAQMDMLNRDLRFLAGSLAPTLRGGRSARSLGVFDRLASLLPDEDVE